MTLGDRVVVRKPLPSLVLRLGHDRGSLGVDPQPAVVTARVDHLASAIEWQLRATSSVEPRPHFASWATTRLRDDDPSFTGRRGNTDGGIAVPPGELGELHAPGLAVPFPPSLLVDTPNE